MPDAPHGGRVLDIPGLLRHHFDATGEKQADVVARAQRQGHRLSRQQLSKFAAGLNRCPTAEAVRALAAGLRTTERAVWLAVGASLGLNVGAPELADRIDPASGDLPDEVQDAFNLLLRSITRNVHAPPEVVVDDVARVVHWPKSEAPSRQRGPVRSPNENRR